MSFQNAIRKCNFKNPFKHVVQTTTSKMHCRSDHKYNSTIQLEDVLQKSCTKLQVDTAFRKCNLKMSLTNVINKCNPQMQFKKHFQKCNSERRVQNTFQKLHQTSSTRNLANTEFSLTTIPGGERKTAKER